MDEQNNLYRKISSVEDLGVMIRQQRKSLHYRQQDLSDLTTLSIRFLSEVERGKPRAEIGKVIEYLHSLGLDLYLKPREL